MTKIHTDDFVHTINNTIGTIIVQYMDTKLENQIVVYNALYASFMFSSEIFVPSR